MGWKHNNTYWSLKNAAVVLNAVRIVPGTHAHPLQVITALPNPATMFCDHFCIKRFQLHFVTTIFQKIEIMLETTI